MKKYSVLIVEDNVTKQNALATAMPILHEFDTNFAPSISQAYIAISRKPYDIIILDMTFQVSQSAGRETSKEAIAGIELLQYMSRRRIRSLVIVATQHTSFSTPETPGIDSIEKLDSLLSELFPANYRTTVKVDLSEDSWRTQFESAVMKVIGEL